MAEKTSKIQLTFPWQGHQVGDTLDVQEHVARRLVFKGRARRVGTDKNAEQAPAPARDKGKGA